MRVPELRLLPDSFADRSWALGRHAVGDIGFHVSWVVGVVALLGLLWERLGAGAAVGGTVLVVVVSLGRLLAAAAAAGRGATLHLLGVRVHDGPAGPAGRSDRGSEPAARSVVPAAAAGRAGLVSLATAASGAAVLGLAATLLSDGVVALASGSAAWVVTGLTVLGALPLRALDGGAIVAGVRWGGWQEMAPPGTLGGWPALAVAALLVADAVVLVPLPLTHESAPEVVGATPAIAATASDADDGPAVLAVLVERRAATLPDVVRAVLGPAAVRGGTASTATTETGSGHGNTAVDEAAAALVLALVGGEGAGDLRRAPGRLREDPEAGLALALATYQALAPGAGRAGPGVVAGIGALDLAGRVLPVCRVAARVRAAEDAGAVVVVVAAEQEEEARRAAGDLHVIGATDLATAVAPLTAAGWRDRP
jgi:hypothetical protein